MLTLQRKIRKVSDKIDIGCGKNKRDGFVGIDMVDFGQEILWDVRDGIPLPDDSVSCIYTSHFVEHLSNEELDDLFYEMTRVCTGTIEIRCPHAETDEAKFVCHNSLWDEQRIRGIEHGLRTSENTLEIISIEREGINLIAKLKVCKNLTLAVGNKK